MLQIENVLSVVFHPLFAPTSSNAPSLLSSLNCSKGQVAKQEDLKKSFGTTDVSEIVRQILEKGELQVGGKEREVELESTRKEIATGVAERCVDPTTQRPHTVTMIEKALAEIHFNVLPNKSTKSQVERPSKRCRSANSDHLRYATSCRYWTQ